MGDGWLRVTSVSVAKKMVNLRGVFGGSTILKQVPLEMVFEDREAWYKDWSESESYKCM